jgi:hypothetical protein
MCIEYDGAQHYQVVERWGGVKSFYDRQLKDKIKTDFCKNNNINLLRIPYTEFSNINEILKDNIK